MLFLIMPQLTYANEQQYLCKHEQDEHHADFVPRLHEARIQGQDRSDLP